MQMIHKMLDWFKSLFWKEEMELTLVGLQHAGKTTFVNVIASGDFNEDMIPTVGFNMRKISKGNVTIKLWDIGGQPRFRSMWERYCRGVNAIVYMVDAADLDKIEASRNELHNLLEKPQVCSSLLRGMFWSCLKTLPPSLAAGRHPDLGVGQQARPSRRPRRKRPHREDEPERHPGQGDLLLLRLLQGEGQHRHHAAVAHLSLQVRRRELSPCSGPGQG